MKIDHGGPIGPLEAAAVLAVLARFEEEQAYLRSIAPQPLRQSKWVMSGRPRAVTPRSVTRPAPEGGGWGLEESDTEPPTPA
ncbi:MAG: hypothetical protein Q8Q29_06115 [Actinomycetota bacterium]|nr:hypothetical protein [Actinomycetota bacterium]